MCCRALPWCAMGGRGRGGGTIQRAFAGKCLFLRGLIDVQLTPADHALRSSPKHIFDLEKLQFTDAFGRRYCGPSQSQFTENKVVSKFDSAVVRATR